MRTDEQVLHDRINLQRLMKRLELAIQDDDWSKSSSPKHETWIKARAKLQQIRHAQLLLKNVELDDVDPTPAQERRYQHLGTTLKHLEDYMRQVEQQSTPPVRRPKPLLPSLPPPRSTALHISVTPSTPPPVEATLIPAEIPEGSSSTDVHEDLLPASPDVSSLPPPPLPPSVPDPGPSAPPSTSTSTSIPTPAPPSTSNITATPTLHPNSHALHDQLSDQLARMATQLRLNATHFSQVLDKDRSLVDTLQEKLVRNVDGVQRERVRLRDLRGSSILGSTTCLALTSVLVVLIAFFFMVFFIRLTR